MDFSNLQISFTPTLAKLLFDLNTSILISTYQAGRVIAIGSSDGEKLHQVPFVFKKPMGIAIQDSKLAIATLDEIHFLSNKGAIENHKKLNKKQFDSFFIHRALYNTNKLDIHDIDFGKGSLWGINTSFSCLCKFDVNYSFVPKWKPNFISKLHPEDRCHLNGLAIEEGVPKYVTALSQTDEKEGWRKDIMNTGVLMEVPSGEFILENLAMPHSPRIINGELYLLESGNGNLLKVDPQKKESTIIYSFNRFVRGLSHQNGYLFIGTSKIRETSKAFNGLDVKENSKSAGVIVFDLNKKEIVATLDYITTVEEIFDVQVLKDIKKPAIINYEDERNKDIITSPFGVFWKKNHELD